MESKERPLSSRATMNDVAALAGVSLKTVSRVINNEPTVNEALAQRVRAAVEQLRYQPNFGASALRRRDGRSSTIGVLLEDLSNPFSATIFRAIEEVATARSVSVLGGSLDERPEREVELTTSLVRHRVDGVILAPASGDHRYLKIDQDAGIPFVFVDRPPRHLEADFVISDNRGGAALAVRHLVDHGHRRIAFLGDLTSLWTAEERFLGYREALQDAGLTLDVDMVVQDLRTIDAAHAAVEHLLGLAVPPTAIFTGQNLLTIGAVRSIRARALQRNIAIVGFDDFLLADLMEPGVTVVAQDVAAIGAQAANLLFARIDGDHTASRHVVLSSRLIPRGSGEIRA